MQEHSSPLFSPPETKPASRRLYWVMFAVGIFAVIVGAADVTARIARAVFGSQASTAAFGPAVLLEHLSTSTAPAGADLGTGANDPLVPVRLLIPSLGIDAHVEEVGKKADGSMGTPQTFSDVAWYALGSKPGAPGNAVIAGHVNNALTKAGVFEHLSQVRLGDTMQMLDGSGNALSYQVTDIVAYPANTAPAQSIFSTTGVSRLVLITCDGDWVSSEHQFDKRLVVYATLVD